MDFENSNFEIWINEQAQLAMRKVTSGETLKPTEIMILVLRAQTNHVAHLEQDLRKEMVGLHREIKDLREDMNKRFEQVDKRFEQVDRRLEKADSRMDAMLLQMNSFMRWSFATTIGVGALIIAFMQLLN